MSARISEALKRKREALARAQRDAAIPMPVDRQLIFDRPRKLYIAVCEWGYGIHEIAAAAIRLAQDEVPARSKPRQLLVYEYLAGDVRVDEENDLQPTGWNGGDPTWPNGVKVRLVGLTNTHALFIQTPRI